MYVLINININIFKILKFKFKFKKKLMDGTKPNGRNRGWKSTTQRRRPRRYRAPVSSAAMANGNMALQAHGDIARVAACGVISSRRCCKSCSLRRCKLTVALQEL